MSIKTKSENLFESFLQANGVRFEQIEQATTPRPDYLIYDGRNGKIIFEIKELAEDDNFGVVHPTHPHITSFSAIVGEHVRRRIELSKRQIQYGAKQGIPSVLLIYNSLDPLQMVGTEDVDFTTAMYGQLTTLINKKTGAGSELFHGRNQLLQKNKNTSFSAVGHLCDRSGKTTVKLFENAYAAVKLPFDAMPPCLGVVRVQLDDDVPLVVP